MTIQTLRSHRQARTASGVRASVRRELASGLHSSREIARDAGPCFDEGLQLSRWIDVEWVSHCLDSGGIDHSCDDEDRLHITGIGFPAWLATDTRSRGIFAVSHCDVAEGTDAGEALRFANHCNETFVQVQFVWSQGAGRLYAHFTLPFTDGLSRRQVLRGLNRFGSIFARAVAEGAACGILAPPGAEVS